MIFGGPIFTTIAQRLGVRKTLAIAFGLWPLMLGVVLSGVFALVVPACVILGLLFSGLPILITLYVVENTTAADYGPSFAAATLAFGIAHRSAAYWRRHSGSERHLPVRIFAFGGHQFGGPGRCTEIAQDRIAARIGGQMRSPKPSRTTGLIFATCNNDSTQSRIDSSKDLKVIPVTSRIRSLRSSH